MLTEKIEVLTPLTDSAMKTYELFAKGFDIDKIAELRSLKLNTIEDHVIEIVSAKRDFPFISFISAEQIRKVLHISRELQTKKIKRIREQLPELSFFQIRIALTKGEEVNG
jgi:uncharacterized protein YpbB